MTSSVHQTTSSSENTEFNRLKSRNEQLEKGLITAQVTAEVYLEVNAKLRAHIEGLQKRLAQVETRNKELENPKAGPRYSSLNWRGKVIFCIRKWKRPLRLQEIISELGIMEAEAGSQGYFEDKFISVVLAKAVKEKTLHIEKLPGSRGAYYALPEWVDEIGKLSPKM